MALLPTEPVPAEPDEQAPLRNGGRGVGASIAALTAKYGRLDSAPLLRPLIEAEFAGRLAVVSSFGVESAIVLAQVASIDRRTPVLFLDTGKLFHETLRYRERLIDRLGLEDVRTIGPEESRLAAEDPSETLWLDNPDHCCAIRKTEPLAVALAGFDAWVTGRKRYQGGARSLLPTFEVDGSGRVKVNPLATWSRERIDREFLAHGLPRHPLEAAGYPSVGCITCTDRVLPGEPLRAGRWRGRTKTECGIHRFPEDANEISHRGEPVAEGRDG